jgi:predicted ATPase with chaperone activity
MFARHQQPDGLVLAGFLEHNAAEATLVVGGPSFDGVVRHTHGVPHVASPATPTCVWPMCASRRCKLDEAGESLLRAAMSQLNLSARAYHRVLTCACGTGAGKLARTIADLAGSEQIQTPHVAEALQCRPKLMLG